jgi:hypothetical protein
LFSRGPFRSPIVADESKSREIASIVSIRAETESPSFFVFFFFCFFFFNVSPSSGPSFLDAIAESGAGD